jgi:hypothetical protein
MIRGTETPVVVWSDALGNAVGLARDVTEDAMTIRTSPLARGTAVHVTFLALGRCYLAEPGAGERAARADEPDGPAMRAYGVVERLSGNGASPYHLRLRIHTWR